MTNTPRPCYCFLVKKKTLKNNLISHPRRTQNFKKTIILISNLTFLDVLPYGTGQQAIGNEYQYHGSRANWGRAVLGGGVRGTT